MNQRAILQSSTKWTRENHKNAESKRSLAELYKSKSNNAEIEETKKKLMN